MRATGGQYLSGSNPAGKTAVVAVVAAVPVADERASVCGAPRSGDSSAVHSPAATRSISRADRDHRVAEAVELGEVLALGRLDHQRAGHREASSSGRGSRSR